MTEQSAADEQQKHYADLWPAMDGCDAVESATKTICSMPQIFISLTASI